MTEPSTDTSLYTKELNKVDLTLLSNLGLILSTRYFSLGHINS